MRSSARTTRYLPFYLAAIWLPACARKDLRLVDGSQFKAYVYQASKPWGEPLAAQKFRPEVCQGEDLAPVYERLDENDLTQFLQRQKASVQIERPREDLVYLTVEGVGTAKPARLRVAILANADEAGRELAQAIAQHGTGSWGVHRSNLAVLGPIGDTTHDLGFAARIKLVCWGVFTIAGKEETVVIPGGYREL